MYLYMYVYVSTGGRQNHTDAVLVVRSVSLDSITNAVNYSSSSNTDCAKCTEKPTKVTHWLCIVIVTVVHFY